MIQDKESVSPMLGETVLYSLLILLIMSAMYHVFKYAEYGSPCYFIAMILLFLLLFSTLITPIKDIMKIYEKLKEERK